MQKFSHQFLALGFICLSLFSSWSRAASESGGPEEPHDSRLVGPEEMCALTLKIPQVAYSTPSAFNDFPEYTSTFGEGLAGLKKALLGAGINERVAASVITQFTQYVEYLEPMAHLFPHYSILDEFKRGTKRVHVAVLKEGRRLLARTNLVRGHDIRVHFSDSDGRIIPEERSENSTLLWRYRGYAVHDEVLKGRDIYNPVVFLPWNANTSALGITKMSTLITETLVAGLVRLYYFDLLTEWIKFNRMYLTKIMFIPLHTFNHLRNRPPDPKEPLEIGSSLDSQNIFKAYFKEGRDKDTHLVGNPGWWNTFIETGVWVAQNRFRLSQVGLNSPAATELTAAYLTRAREHLMNEVPFAREFLTTPSFASPDPAVPYDFIEWHKRVEFGMRRLIIEAKFFGIRQGYFRRDGSEAAWWLVKE